MATATRPRPSTATVVRVVLTVAAVLLLLYAIYLVRSILVLVIIAAFLALGLDPAVRRLERMKLRRGFAVGLIFFLAVAFIVAFLLAVIPPLVEQVGRFATNLPEYIQDLADRNPRVQEWVDDNDISAKLQEATKNVPSLISGSLGGVLGVAGSVASGLFNMLTIIVLTIYFLLSLSHIREGSLKLVLKSKRQQVSRLVDPIIEKIGGYLAGQISVALIAGVLALIFLAIVGVPYALALALWVAIAALIPMVGATLGAIPAVIVAFFDSTGIGVTTLIYFIAYQQIENYVIAPRIMTRAVDVSPAVVLLAALIGASLLGFVGALMAIPTAASIKLIVNEVVIPKVEEA